MSAESWEKKMPELLYSKVLCGRKLRRFCHKSCISLMSIRFLTLCLRCSATILKEKLETVSWRRSHTVAYLSISCRISASEKFVLKRLLHYWISIGCFTVLDLKKLIEENEKYLRAIDRKRLLKDCSMIDEKRIYLEELCSGTWYGDKEILAFLNFRLKVIYSNSW